MRERRRASRQWRAVAGRLTAPKELVSCIWRRAPQIIGEAVRHTLSKSPPFLFFPYVSLVALFLSISLSLAFLRFAHCERPTGTGALLFLYFSLPFSPCFSSARVTFSLNTERAGRSKDAGATAANDMRPAAAGQLGNSRTQDLGLPRNEPSRKVPTTSFSRYE